MTSAEIEKTYEALAKAIDSVDPEQSEIFLAKLALLLSREIGDTKVVFSLIEQAAQFHER